MTGGKVQTWLIRRFRLLRVLELEFQLCIPTFWIHKWSVKSCHGLQWVASKGFYLPSWKPGQNKPKSRLLNIVLTQVGFFDFSAFKSRLQALIKKARPRSLIYGVKILDFHLVPSFGWFRVGAEKFHIQSICPTYSSISTWKIELLQTSLLFRVGTTQGHSGPQ
jgi:hypothetical protein